MISVILPTYNRAHLLPRAISSVLEQSYSDIELIVVDDGSTDDTEKVVHSIQDERLHYVKLSNNQGACAARNAGIRAAQGEYIAFQDSDDRWHADKLAKQLDFLQQTGADFVFCAFTHHDEKNGTSTQLPPPHIRPGRIRYEDLLPGNLISTQTLLSRRECFLSHPFNEKFPRLQDWEVSLRIAQDYQIFYDDHSLVDVYLQADSLSKHPERGLWAIEQLAQQHHDALQKNPVAAIGFAESYAHFSRQCGQNAWPGYFKLLPRRFTAAVIRSILAEVKRTLTHK